MNQSEYDKCRAVAELFRRQQRRIRQLEQRIAELEGRMAKIEEEDRQVILMVQMNRRKHQC